MARTPALDTGDVYEFSISAQLKPKPGVEMWVKSGAIGTVREGESGAKCAARVELFVEDRLNRKIEEVMGE